MNYEEIKRSQHMYALKVTATENTWSHARRRRREQQRKQEPIPADQNGGHSTSNVLNTSTEDTAMDIDTSSESIGHKRPRSNDSDDEGYYNNIKKLKVSSTNEEIYLKITLVLRRLASEYHLEMSWIEGSAGRDTVHQVMQYFKNNWK